MNKKVVITLLLLVACCYLCFAQSSDSAGALSPTDDESKMTFTDSTPTENATPSSSSTASYFLRMILVLVLILAVIYLLYYFLKRATKPNVNEDPNLKVLASSSLGAGKNVHVISVGKSAFLIGATDNNINLISKIEDQETIDNLVLQASKNPSPVKKDFGSLMVGLLNPKGNRKSENLAASSSDFLRHQRDRLKKF